MQRTPLMTTVFIGIGVLLMYSGITGKKPLSVLKATVGNGKAEPWSYDAFNMPATGDIGGGNFSAPAKPTTGHSSGSGMGTGHASGNQTGIPQ